MSQPQIVQGGFPPPNQPATGGFPPPVGGFPPNQLATGGLPPPAGGYPPNQPGTTGGIPPSVGGYPPGQPAAAGGFPPTAGGYPPNQPGTAGGYPPGQPAAAGGFPPTEGGLPPSTGGPPAEAPPLDQLKGYEGLTLDSSALKPPVYDEIYAPKEISVDIKNAPSLTEEQAREALLGYVSQHCCYGSKAAKNMVIKDITFNSAIHYKLETFGEKRETAWAFEPYKSSATPIQAGGYVPNAWEIQVPHNGNFCNCQKVCEVPNTTSIRVCHKCMGSGDIRCTHCHGHGGEKCHWCHGSGHRRNAQGESEHCHTCHGSGFASCIYCHGHGHVTCDVCKGQRNLRYFIKLTCTWTDHIEDYISDTADLPSELIRDVSGQTAFEDEQPRVGPVTNFPDPGVNEASQRLVEKHRNEFTQERILMQRQQVRIVPIAKIDYSWKNADGEFQVYGFENVVYFPNYPQSCCWGCQII